MTKLIVAALLSNAVLLAGRFWQELDANAEIGQRFTSGVPPATRSKWTARRRFTGFAEPAWGRSFLMPTVMRSEGEVLRTAASAGTRPAASTAPDGTWICAMR